MSRSEITRHLPERAGGNLSVSRVCCGFFDVKAISDYLSNMIVIGLLLLIVAILLFGAGAVGNTLSAIGTVILFLIGGLILAYGLEWDSETITVAVLIVVGIGGWFVWALSRDPFQ
jgi:hypothetical protein